MKRLINHILTPLTGFLLVLFLTISFSSCKKYLDATPDRTLVVPTSLNDLQALLDNNNTINRLLIGLGEASADNYYVTYEDWSSFEKGYRNVYVWGDELFFDNTNNVWLQLYRPVYYANIVLENLLEIDRTPENDHKWDNLKGSALFIRARSFFILVTTFSKAFDHTTEDEDLGIPLRLTSDFNIKSVRATVGASYDRIISDLKMAIALLPASPLHVMRPSKPAAYGLLSRVYLSMRKYEQSGLYADSCLLLHNDLMNYNGGDGVNASGSSDVFGRFNPEVIFSSYGGIVPLTKSNARVDTVLYGLYDDYDLRKKLFFRENDDGSHAFVGNYWDQYSKFYGLATDEMYLTRAECEIRLGHIKSALDDLNTLLEKRWKTGSFSPITSSDPDKILTIILRERRKELLFRNLRWMDIKRLNKEGRNIIIKRNINGDVYSLKPNGNKFALPLPSYIIRLTGMKQNPR